ncbi:MAG: insulinase family protein [Candidatus Hydrothermae bacterium]|nr:insulinase family protein [Candidatus Hydrothermae bacterium]
MSLTLVALGSAVELNFPLTTFTLPNGLQVAVVEDHANPLVSVQLWFRVGSRNESYGITGISHVLEHMMFKGTRKMKSEEYSRTIQRWGGMDNAFTSEDQTAYFSEVPKARLKDILNMEYDRVANAVFREFESELNVVREERRWRTENSPEGSLYELLRATAYIAHPYRHPVVGWMSDLEHLTLEDVERYFHTYYVPNNLILVISGDVTPEEVRPLVESTFGKLPRRPDPPAVRTREPRQEGLRRVELKREGFASYVAVAFHIPEGKHPDLPALTLLAHVLTDGKSSRLYRELVKEKTVATDVQGWVEQQLDPGLFVLWVSVQQGHTPEEVESLLFQTLNKLKTQPITERELEKAKNRTMANFVRRYQSVVSKGMLVGSWAILDRPEAALEWPRKIQAVTLDDVQRVATTYLVKDQATVAILRSVPPKDMNAFLEKMKQASQKRFRR